MRRTDEVRVRVEAVEVGVEEPSRTVAQRFGGNKVWGPVV